ncbi:MAG: hypothetical protein KF712_07910 [Akkermansiaceae bacterium]|nr:hypothetical protein [Akkermansiaceae bacterium]
MDVNGDYLSLKDSSPIAKGGLRLVFPYPGDPSRLVKVMRPDKVASRYGDEGGTWFRRNRRHGEYILFVREIREYIAAYASHGRSLPFVQRIRGMVETDLGLGLVLDAARDREGNLAPTLAKVIFNGAFNREAEEALATFLREMLECDVVFADLHERNLVHAAGEDGKLRFVMIDGLGESNLLPLKSWFPSLNRSSKRKRIERLEKRVAGRLAAFRSGNPIP